MYLLPLSVMNDDLNGATNYIIAITIWYCNTIFKMRYKKKDTAKINKQQ